MKSILQSLNNGIRWNLTKDEIQTGNAPKCRNILMSNSRFGQGHINHYSMIQYRTDHHASTNEGKNEGLPGLTTSALQ